MRRAALYGPANDYARSPETAGPPRSSRFKRLVASGLLAATLGGCATNPNPEQPSSNAGPMAALVLVGMGVVGISSYLYGVEYAQKHEKRLQRDLTAEQERVRQLQQELRSQPSSPRVEYRYRTRTVRDTVHRTDTVYVNVPQRIQRATRLPQNRLLLRAGDVYLTFPTIDLLCETREQRACILVQDVLRYDGARRLPDG